MGDCGDFVFFFWELRDDDVGIRGVSSSFTSEFEFGVWGFVFIWRSVNRSPLASVLGSFFIKYAKSVACWCQSFDHKFVFLWMGTPPLQMLKIEVNSNKDGRVV